MSFKTFFFAGGGTGGHIYPNIAVAEKIIQSRPNAKIHFFCSERDIDLQILSKTNFACTRLPAKQFSPKPKKLIDFIKGFTKSTKIARGKILQSDNSVVTGSGGFAAAPVCWAAHKLKVPIKLVNTDMIPGRANKIIARWADEIFVQFEQTAKFFAGTKAAVTVTGCPLRSSFDKPNPSEIKSKLGLDEDKKILLVTGASSGAKTINDTVCALLGQLEKFADDWQIVHLAGNANFKEVKEKYTDAKITHKVLDYCETIADLLSAAELGIGRSGAVSIAEYAVSRLPMICMPYPHHNDMHQYLNAGALVEAGAAVVVDDLPDAVDRPFDFAQDRKEWLWEELERLMGDDKEREQMRKNAKAIAVRDAARKIAEKLNADT